MSAVITTYITEYIAAVQHFLITVWGAVATLVYTHPVLCTVTMLAVELTGWAWDRGHSTP